MANEHDRRERVLELVAHRPWHTFAGVIKIPRLSERWRVRHSSDLRTSPTSSLGDLDEFPLELLHAIFAMLDIKSLLDISRTCLRGNELVKSTAEYRDLMRYASPELAALGKTRMIRAHAAATIHAALVSPNCISCGCYGAFLFLPTCERHCFHCLLRNQSLWVVPVAMAQKCFGYSAAGAETLSVMLSESGFYGHKKRNSRLKSLRMVCVGDAKKLAIAEHISESCMRQHLEHRRLDLSFKEYNLFLFLQGAHITPPGLEPFVQPIETSVPDDSYYGMASVPFSYLAPDNHVEHGYLCAGCEIYWSKWRAPLSAWNDPIAGHLPHEVDAGCCARHLPEDMPFVARLRTEFLSHISQCPGAKELIEAGKIVIDNGTDLRYFPDCRRRLVAKLRKR